MAKKFLTLLLAAITVVTMLALPSTALNALDWTVVGAGSSDSTTVVSVTEAKGIQLTQEGHYPENNAGLVYSKPLSLEGDGITIDIVVNTSMKGSADAWYGIFFLNKPVYFKHTGNTSDDGYGIVLLCRESQFQWLRIDDNNDFALVGTDDYTNFSSKDYFAENAEVEFNVKLVDGEIVVFVDGKEITGDYTGLREYFADNQGYIGFSMSETSGMKQTFTIRGINGEAAAAEGEITTNGGAAETDPTIDFDNVSEFVLADFTSEAFVKTITNLNDCTVEYDATEGCLKVTVTDTNNDGVYDPWFQVPMKKYQYFDGTKFTQSVLTYKCDFSDGGNFFFFSKSAPAFIAQTSIDMYYDGVTEYTDIITDMDDNDSWADEIRGLRIDPVADGQEGQVIYYKTLSIREYVAPATTTADPSLSTAAPETDAPGTTVATPDSTDADVTKADSTTVDNGSKGGSNIGLIIGIIAAVVVVAVVVIVIIVTKKKKK